MSTEQLKPLVPYFGGKARLAPWISSLFPTHRTYVEPFAGSAAVLLAKRPAIHEILNDVDGNVVNFYRVLRERPADLERVCKLTPYARDEFTAADLVEQGLDDVERARRWWIRLTQGFAGVTRPNNGWALSTRQGGSDAGSARGSVTRFAAVSDRLARVAIENRDAIEVIRAHDRPETVVYADPPYVAESRTSHADGYAHELAGEDQHRALAEVLHDATSTVFLSGYHSALYDELYADWHQVERLVVRRSNNGHQDELEHRAEVVWSNRPLDVDEHLLTHLDTQETR